MNDDMKPLTATEMREILAESNKFWLEFIQTYLFGSELHKKAEKHMI